MYSEHARIIIHDITQYSFDVINEPFGEIIMHFAFIRAHKEAVGDNTRLNIYASPALIPTFSMYYGSYII